METEKKEQKIEGKAEKTSSHHVKMETEKKEQKIISKAVPEKKPEAKPEEKKAEQKQLQKKEIAIASSRSIHASRKVCSYICAFIKNKSIDQAISDLERVIKFKSAVPYKGELPHRKGMMSGRYPIKASGIFIKLLKSLRG